MKYIKEIKSQDFELALGLDKDQVRRLKGAIKKAYDQNWPDEGPNVDLINSFVAPYIKTQEEAYYVATVIVTDIMGVMMEHNLKFKP